MSEASLQQLLRRGTLPHKSFRLPILVQIAAALDQANRTDAKHRSSAYGYSIDGNLTPQSIMISEETNGRDVVVSVKDFGTTFVLDNEMVMGSDLPDGAHYLSPERILGINVDARSDEFSFAAIAYELLCGQRAFEAAGISALFYKICTEGAAPITSVDPSLNSSVDAVLKRALAKSPKGRFASCGGFVEALGAALESCPHWKEKTPLAAATAVGAGESKMFSNAGLHAPRLAVSTEGLVSKQAEYRVLSYRGRSRYDQADDSERAGSGIKNVAIGVALGLLAAGLGLSVWNWTSKPKLPVQAADNDASRQIQLPARETTATTPVAPAVVDSSASTPLQAEHEAPKRVAGISDGTGMNQSTTKERGTFPEGGVASVDLLTQPPGSRIVVDNSTVCTAPCTLSLRNGRHTLTARLNGYAVEQRIFTVPEDSSLFIALSRQLGTLVVTSVPAAATIMLDGTDYGLTPATLHLPPGQHHLTLTNGSQQHIATVTVVADAIQASAYNFAQ